MTIAHNTKGTDWDSQHQVQFARAFRYQLIVAAILLGAFLPHERCGWVGDRVSAQWCCFTMRQAKGHFSLFLSKGSRTMLNYPLFNPTSDILALQSVMYHLSALVPKLKGDASEHNSSRRRFSSAARGILLEIGDVHHVTLWQRQLCTCSPHLLYVFSLSFRSSWCNKNIIQLLFAVLIFLRLCYLIRAGNSIWNRKIKLDLTKSVLCRKEGLTGRRCHEIRSRKVWRKAKVSGLKHCLQSKQVIVVFAGTALLVWLQQ